jgi:formylglycine-generating enzyme required for sulfatase activity
MIFAWGATLLPACSVVFPASDLVGDSLPAEAGSVDVGGLDVIEAGTEAAPPADAADGSVSTVDAPFDVASGQCPAGRGPSMIDAGGFCIDSTEVTNAQYAAFLDAGGGDASGQPSWCTWNNSYRPSQGWPAPTGTETWPVVFVDWCDALAFCAWAGKRLCGAVKGGAMPFGGGTLTDPAVDQWFHACSHNGDDDYPYGVTYSLGRCNDADSGVNKTVAVPSSSECTGGYPGLFDMVGNVNEWEDACEDVLDASSMCGARSGSFRTPKVGSDAKCADTSVVAHRDTSYDDMGIRCCAP